MVCNLEIVSQTRKIQTQHKKTNTAHGGGGRGEKKNTQLTTKILKENTTHITRVYKHTYTHAHQRKQKLKSLIHDMRRTGNPSRWQIPSAWSLTFSSGIRSI